MLKLPYEIREREKRWWKGVKMLIFNRLAACDREKALEKIISK